MYAENAGVVFCQCDNLFLFAFLRSFADKNSFFIAEEQ